MELAERETLIAINERERKEGYFTVMTTEDRIFAKLIKKVPKEELKVKEFINNGKVIQRKIKVPVKYLNLSYLPLRAIRVVSPERKEAMSQHGRKLFKSRIPNEIKG